MAEGPTATLGIEYRERYVAFLDLLGFKVLVDAAETTLEERGRLAEVLDRLSQTLCNAPTIGGRFTYFSDCIVITADATPQGLWHVFRSIELLTRNLLQFDVFVRGAVTRGGAFHSTEYVYGTAVSRAAVLEKDEALNPLTLLSPEVLEDVRKLGPDFLQWLQSDGHDRHFVHYLGEYATFHSTPALPGKVSLDVDADRIAFYVSRRLLNDAGRVLAKAQWLQAYWNRTVARPGGFAEIHADPSLAEPGGPRTTIHSRVVAR
jgi:hypothetical protein